MSQSWPSKGKVISYKTAKKEQKGELRDICNANTWIDDTVVGRTKERHIEICMAARSVGKRIG